MSEPKPPPSDKEETPFQRFLKLARFVTNAKKKKSP
jgi:hypothetical protein